MSTVNGLPAHILLNHFVVVLGPLTAILAIMCALWPAARRRLIWLVLVLSVITLIVTPLTTSSGAWLMGKVGAPPPVRVHAELGETMIYFVACLMAALILLAAVHIRQARGRTVRLALHAVVGVLVIAAAVATLVQTYRIGDSGARAAWGNTASDSGGSSP
jgi:glucan phosphoethanolaminetransferase (alkaline phosphatase superfamily)